MLTEMVVTNLGVIERSELLLGPGMTALTGETGAGKTLVVQAIGLLTGGRADPVVVGPHGDEARVDGRFELDGQELVLSRVVVRGGRSRAYIDGAPATVAQLAEVGAKVVDLHGQHAHQSLLSTAKQRAALDRFAGVDLTALRAANDEVTALERELEGLGGDERARTREVELIRYQLDELEAAGLDDPDEEDVLDQRERILADATAHREAGARVLELLADDDGVRDTIGRALAELQARAPYEELADRLGGLAAELDDVVTELRSAADDITDDPESLAALRERRQLLRELRRKYGETLGEVLEFADQQAKRLAELEGYEARAAELGAELDAARERRAVEAASVARLRKAAAGPLADRVEARFAELALPGARLDVEVGGDDPGDHVELRFEANGEPPPQPLAKVASGGELARVMLALRMVLTAGPPTLVFDEVDAGIGGDAARAVGAALARVADEHQVIVVTHLPQVAANADAHVVISKDRRSGRVVSTAATVDRSDRVAELARMLSGGAESDTARAHAAELLAEAGALAR
ncbi:MAG: DNA repair protein RecN [Actinomycetota bacterium]